MAAQALVWQPDDPSRIPLLVHNSKISSFLPAFPPARPNISHTSDGSWSFSAGERYLQNIEIVLPELLWHPGRFLLNIAISIYHFILAAPPLVHCALVYFILRYAIYKWLIWAIKDYQAYLDLGRGGSPCDVWGWWRVKRLKLMAGLNVLDPPHVPPMLEPYRGILWRLNQRDGPRPIVKGIAPQRQITQRTPVSTFDALLSMIATFADANARDLRVEKSFLEGHTAALKLNCSDMTGVPKTKGEFGYEICHPHRNDGSIHMIMHPEDIRTVIEAGWGERHPLATSRWYWRLWYHSIRRKRTPVSEFLVLIYAPRDQDELEVVYRLMQASIWFAARKVLDGKIPQLDSYATDYISDRRAFSPSICSRCNCYDG